LKQKQILDEFIDTSRYVYNKTLEYIKNGHKPNFQSLRDILVTENTKKGYADYKIHQEEIKELHILKKQTDIKSEIDEINKTIKDKAQKFRDYMKKFEYVKNQQVKEFELFTAKDIRSNAVKRCCDAYKSGFTNLKRGNIKFFNLKFKKKKDTVQSIELTPKNISIDKGVIKILPETFKENCYLNISKTNKKKYINLEIKNNVDIVRDQGNYYLHISIETETKERKDLTSVCGIDLGVRTFATVHTNTCCDTKTTITEYKHRVDIMRNLNKKIVLLKKTKIHYRKKQYNKIEKRKSDLVNKLHWDFINDILSHNDIIYLGDIKSQGIVKGGKNKTLNRDMNDLKFHILKQRLQYKAALCNKLVFLIPEPYTTKCCSNCGTINNNVGCKEVFNCSNCGLNTGRDVNASKNIKMKGILT
jgi:putative transposase